jgi:5'-deoxynucleotidase YfbR-like HD superfamily hydrolase
MRKALDFILRGAEVKRFHTTHTLVSETVGHHSHGVAALCCLIYGRGVTANVLKAAALHDLAECITGDIPSPAKRAYGIGQQVNELETTLLEGADLHMPHLNETDAQVLKLADIAHGALFCIREMELGNRKMLYIYRNYISYADQLGHLLGSKELFNLIEERFKNVG